MTKRITTLLLAAAMLLGTATVGSAIEFKTKGIWSMNYEYGSGGNFTERGRSVNGTKGTHTTGWGRYGEDQFEAKSRVRLQLDAVASEALSGTVYFEIGGITWGRANRGGALGADGTMVKIKHSYLDWVVPQTEVKVRMGIERIFLPDFTTEASQAFDADTAGITVSVPVNENLSLTGFWARAYNDNWAGTGNSPQSYLDNFDLFGLTAPLRFEGLNITPWGLVGAFGSNTFRKNNDFYGKNNDGAGALGVAPATYALNDGKVGRQIANAYSTIFWAGLTGEAVAWNPFRLAWSFNYGQSDTGVETLNRKGWYGSLLAEYSMDWGVPGIYGWYTSGDDGNVKNGSERMPSIAGAGNFTSFVGDGNLSWSPVANGCDWSMSYAGTWGIGAQLKDMSFIENVSHTFRLAYWGGTNATSMVKYMKDASSWQAGYRGDGPYLTTNDGLLEFNLVNTWQAYENLSVNLELGYVANMIDKDTWKKASYNNGAGNGSFEKQDAWKAQLVFQYSF